MPPLARRSIRFAAHEDEALTQNAMEVRLAFVLCHFTRRGDRRNFHGTGVGAPVGPVGAPANPRTKLANALPEDCGIVSVFAPRRHHCVDRIASRARWWQLRKRPVN